MKKINIKIVSSIISIIAILFFTFFLSLEKSSYSYIKVWSIISLAFFVVYCIMLKNLYGTFKDLYIVFFIVYYLFSAGEYILMIFQDSYKNLTVFKSYRFSDYENLLGLKYISLVQTMLFIGAILSYKDKCVAYSINISKERLIRVKNIGVFFMLISIPFDLYEQFRRTLMYMKNGYASGFDSANSIMGTLSYYCIIGSFMYSIGNMNNRGKMRNIGIYYLIFRSTLLLLSGDRGHGIGLLGAIYIFYGNLNKNKKPINRKELVKDVVVVYVFMGIISSVRSIRMIRNKNLMLFLSSFVDACFKGGMIKDVLNELGASIRPLLENINYLESVNGGYKYGMTMIVGLIMIVPSFLRFGLYEKFVQKGWLGIEDELTSSLGINYGLGYSLNAELYCNFGKSGWIFAILLGYIFSKLLNNNYRLDNKNILWQAIKPTLFALFIIFARGTMQLFYKYLFFYALIPVILVNCKVGNISNIKQGVIKRTN